MALLDLKISQSRFKMTQMCPNQLRRACDGRRERLPDPQRPLRPLPERHQREDVPGTESQHLSLKLFNQIAKMMQLIIIHIIIPLFGHF